MSSNTPDTYEIGIDDLAAAPSTPDRPALPADHQVSVNGHFQGAAAHWERLYRVATLDGRIYQDRKAVALRWIDRLQLPGTARVLEVGCGAGFTATELAMRGHRVDAADSVPAMLDLTRKRVAETGTADRVRVLFADVRHLPMPDSSFDLVLALGVLPWLDDPAAAIREMARVTRPGGHVLLTADHNLHLDEILDPKRNPRLESVRRSLARALRAAHVLSPAPLRPQAPLFHRHSRREFDSIVSAAGLDKLWSQMVGFGPFTFFGKLILPDSVGIRVHRLLQAAAHRNVPIVSSHGMQYLLMSRKHP